MQKVEPATQLGVSPAGSVECNLEFAHDLERLLSAMQLRERDQKTQRIYCEASARGLKFTAQSAGKELTMMGWMFSEVFEQYKFTGDEELVMLLPLAPMVNCLQVFGDRASLLLRYPAGFEHGHGGDMGEVYLRLQEAGAITECQLKAFAMDEPPPAPSAFFAPGEATRMFMVSHADVWHQALNEFAEFDNRDVALLIRLCVGEGTGPRVILRAKTINNDAEVELKGPVLTSLNLLEGEQAAEHRFFISSVLAGCRGAARDARAVKVRFNSEGVMSCQFILKGRGSRDFYCETLVSPFADIGGDGLAGSLGKSFMGTQVPGSMFTGTQVPGSNSVGF